ncbi:tail length tape measure protein [Pseudomonas phage Zuri]|uniref:Tape measure protein n=1 Tax=Pseudomonas phage Zuri TaxID=2604899 RepID=A0A5C1K606_9CAUD|nr:tail length tape measure protein [Pseudomonas phage Zuri]QEM41175.1 hypothetical protein Zuri_82 [Pseudomonas phage Zuri]
MGAQTGEEILGMSDEDFLKMEPPVVEAPSVEGAATTEEGQQPAPTPEPVAQTEQVQQQQPAVTEESEEDKANKQPAQPVNKEEPAQPAAVTDAQSGKEQQPAAADKDKGVTQQPEKQPEQAETPPNYEELYKRLMAPLRANGKNIEIRSPEELIQLAQMGANYTRKMQELAPKRKYLQMLENNELLDEGQLSFLIDLKNKNPEAIKKLLKDSGLDPLDLDISTEPAYQQGNHRVSDAEVNFNETLRDLQGSEEGLKTLQAIHTTWDQASKEMLGQNPEILSIMHQQRELGVYDLITAEVDRQRALGQIPQSVSFLQAYKQVGDQLAQGGKLNAAVEKQQPPAQTPPVQVDTRVAAPKAPVVHSDKAAAASPTQAAPKKAQEIVNPLAMKDEDFLKYMNGRL